MSGRFRIFAVILAAAATLPAQGPKAPSVLARVRAAKEIDVAAQILGVVVARPVARNTMVKKGTVILEIDPTFARITVLKARASLAKVTAEEAWAKQELDREESLQAGNSGRAADVDRVRAAWQAAKAALDAQVAIVDEATNRLERCSVRAPENGLLAELYPEIGESVNLTVPVARVLTVQDLVAEAFVRGAEITRFNPGDEATIHVDGMKPLTGRVREVARAAGPGRTYRLVVALPAPPAGLLAGFDARIVLPKVK